MSRNRSLLVESRRARAPEVGRLLASARTAAGRSQAEAAACLGIGQTAIAKLEAGSRRLGLLEAIELGHLYGVSALAFDPDEAPADSQSLSARSSAASPQRA